MFWFSWLCIVAALVYAFKPWLAPAAHHASDIQHARTLLNLYSQNSCSYLALEDDKQLYFGHAVDGVDALTALWTIPSLSTATPSAADEDFPALLSGVQGLL